MKLAKCLRPLNCEQSFPLCLYGSAEAEARQPLTLHELRLHQLPFREKSMWEERTFIICCDGRIWPIWFTSIESWLCPVMKLFACAGGFCEAGMEDSRTNHWYGIQAMKVVWKVLAQQVNMVNAEFWDHKSLVHFRLKSEQSFCWRKTHLPSCAFHTS